MMNTPEFRLQTLGGLEVRHCDRGHVALHGGKACVLLALLAAKPGESMTRAQLSQLLWPGVPGRRQRHSLRQLLSSIRKALSPDMLLETSDGLKLDAERWEVDLWDFAGAMEEGRWEDACRGYRGPFLGGFDADGGSELRALLDSIQARFRLQAEEAFDVLIQAHLRNGDPRTAEQWARHFVGLDPTSERPRALLMEALRGSGRHHDALGEFEEYRVLLDELIEDHPSSHLAALAEEIRMEAGEELLLRRERPPAAPGVRQVGPPARPDLDPLFEAASSAQALPAPVASPGAETPLPGEEVPGEEGAPASGTSGASEPDAPPAARTRWFRSRRLVGVAALAGVALAVAAGIHFLRPPGDTAAAPALPVLALGEDGSRERLLLLPTVVPTGELPWSGTDGMVDPTGRFQVEAVETQDGYDFQVRALADSAVVVGHFSDADELFLAWAPDGGSLLYATVLLSDDLRQSSHRLSILSVPEGRSVPLDDLRPTVVGGASWSPQGTTIAVSASLGGEDHDLFLLAPSGEVLRHLGLPGDQVWPQWSPSGHLLAFESIEDGISQIVVLAPEDDGPTPVDPEPVRQRNPQWLTDTLLVYLRGDNGDGAQLRAIDPLAESESRVIEIQRPILALLPSRDRHRPNTWVDRIEPTLRHLRTPPNSEVHVGLDFFRAEGGPADVPPEDVQWWSGNPEVAQVGPDGVIRTVGVGETVVTASLAGWREVDIPVAVVPLAAVPVETVMVEDWSAGLDTTRWKAFGDPLPYVRTDATPTGGAAFVNNGDGNYDSGVVSRRAFDLSKGLTVEFHAAQPLNGQHFRGLRVMLATSGAIADSGDRLDGQPLVDYTTNSFDQLTTVSIGNEDVAELSLPDRVDDWHPYVLQVEPNGTVTLMTDGVTTWRGSGRHDGFFPDSAYLALSGRSLGTEVLLGPVTVYGGVRYRPEG
jgi:DNA-binding SARP family transcriptional activator